MFYIGKRAYFHHFGTIGHTLELGILARKLLKLGILVVLAILSNHETVLQIILTTISTGTGPNET